MDKVLKLDDHQAISARNSAKMSTNEHRRPLENLKNLGACEDEHLPVKHAIDEVKLQKPRDDGNNEHLPVAKLADDGSQ